MKLAGLNRPFFRSPGILRMSSSFRFLFHDPYMYHILNSLKGAYIGDYIGDYYRGY